MAEPTNGGGIEAGPWTGRDLITALAWGVVAVAARGVLIGRIEGLLDHDQAVVGIMARDIAAGRRWPIFFDGQRYMGAVEAYVAAILVRVLGDSPSVVALAPTLFFGLFVALQFATWRAWAGRSTGNIAALACVACSPMMTLWSVIPRGGYTEIMAWSLATMWAYRRATRPDRPSLGRPARSAWGFLFALGYFLNPLSIVVYVAVAIDWSLGRHGAKLRASLPSRIAAGLDRRIAPLLWLALAALLVTWVAIGCHVDPSRAPYPFVFAMGFASGEVERLIGGAIVVGAVGVSAWRSGLAGRSIRSLAAAPEFAAGALLALTPFLIYNLRVRMGLGIKEPSLPIWIRAPWGIGSNIVDATHALGPLIGGETLGKSGTYLGLLLFHEPDAVFPGFARAVSLFTPLAVALVAFLVGVAAWSDRAGWRRFWSLRGVGPTAPTILPALGLATCLGLFLLQSTSNDRSSIRYLLPIWVFLPGLLATGVVSLPRRIGWTALGLLMAIWIAGQVNLHAEARRPNLERRLVARLEEVGATGLVANGPLGQIAVDLSEGRVGVVDYHGYWPRLGGRYRHRLEPAGPFLCLIDTDRDGPGMTLEDPNERVHALAAETPPRATLVAEVEHYQLWRVVMPPGEFLGEDLSAPR